MLGIYLHSINEYDMPKRNYNWDFSKLPKEEHATAIDLYNKADWWALIQLHNRYKLSGTVYCCNSAEKNIQTWFKYGIETGQITADEQEQEGTGTGEAG